MDKKVVTEKVVEKKIFSKEEIEAALQIAHSEYFMQVMALQSHDASVKEMNYVKCAVTTPDGGTYLISILHIDGPKIDLTKLASAAEEIESRS